jgi:hypothetical protein
VPRNRKFFHPALPPQCLEKLIACLAMEPADLWPLYGETAPYVKQLAEIVWDQKIQWNMAGDALESHHKRDELIQVICHDYPEAAKELGLQCLESVRSLKEPAGSVTLSAHEKAVWNIIQRGLRGQTYCREVDRAGARPRKEWILDGCPGTYQGAYLLGQPWKKRIQDEKSRIQRKAELAGLANRSPAIKT